MEDKNELKIENAIRDILEYYVDDIENEHFNDTPKRVRKAYDEIFRGYIEDPKKFIRLFNAPEVGAENQMIIAGPIKTFSMCAHHLLPFNMNIWIGYIPDKKIIGISKFSRIAKHFCAKATTQEFITNDLADFLYEEIKPIGLGVVIADSKHLCAAMRGAKDENLTFNTARMKGAFLEDKIKSEFLNMIK